MESTPDDEERLAEVGDDLRSVQEAIREWEAGDIGMPLDEAFTVIRSRSQRADSE